MFERATLAARSTFATQTNEGKMQAMAVTCLLDYELLKYEEMMFGVVQRVRAIVEGAWLYSKF